MTIGEDVLLSAGLIVIGVCVVFLIFIVIDQRGRRRRGHDGPLD